MTPAGEVDGLLTFELELGDPTPTGQMDRERLKLRLAIGETAYFSGGKSGWFEGEMLDLQNKLPTGTFMKACFNCAFSDPSPYGHGLFGNMICFRANKAGYLAIPQGEDFEKDDYFDVMDTVSEMEETDLCPEFERRTPGTGYRGRRTESATLTDRTFAPGPTPNTVRAADGTTLTVPEGWTLLPPGDAGLTRRVKAAGDYWVVQEKVGRRMFSRGIWAASTIIERIFAELNAERSTEGYAKKQEAAARRREKMQAEYVEDFLGAVLAFLAFHPDHADMADRLARAVTEHATPVGSGTVARTERIPVEQRAEAAVIAWMRHQTTGYDGMKIPRVKSKRREVRRMLAGRSQDLLRRYRRGEAVGDGCPLKKALVVEGRG